MSVGTVKWRSYRKTSSLVHVIRHEVRSTRGRITRPFVRLKPLEGCRGQNVILSRPAATDRSLESAVILSGTAAKGLLAEWE